MFLVKETGLALFSFHTELLAIANITTNGYFYPCLALLALMLSPSAQCERILNSETISVMSTTTRLTVFLISYQLTHFPDRYVERTPATIGSIIQITDRRSTLFCMSEGPSEHPTGGRWSNFYVKFLCQTDHNLSFSPVASVVPL